MSWTGWLIVGIASLIVAILLTLWLVRILQSIEPYASVLRLRTREKIRFFRLMATDRRVPRKARLIPLLLGIYLAFPVDIIPDFIPGLGYIDDVGVIVLALFLVVRLTPRETLENLIAESRSSGPGEAEG